MALTQVDQGLLGTYAQYTGFKNRIINGAMVIDQRNAGASVSVGTATGTYTLDRWRVYHDTAITSNITAQQSSTVPTTGYTYSQVLTNGTGASPAAGDLNVVQQRVEGYNTGDLNFGASTASTVTLSFWVRSSLTGTFGIGLSNGAQDRTIAYTYTISSANTWEQKTITITGDLSGTWLTTNGIGLIVNWDLGSGTSSNASSTGVWSAGRFTRTSACTNFIGTTGATFYLTGVQLEKGSTATSFDYRPYGTELALCQRYYEQFYGDSAGLVVFSSTYSSQYRAAIWYKVQKRASATFGLMSTGVWNGATPTITSGLTQSNLYNGSTAYYLSSTADSPAAYVSAEL